MVLGRFELARHDARKTFSMRGTMSFEFLTRRLDKSYIRVCSISDPIEISALLAGEDIINQALPVIVY